jgi:hypothetical protein
MAMIQLAKFVLQERSCMNVPTYHVPHFASKGDTA